MGNFKIEYAIIRIYLKGGDTTFLKFSLVKAHFHTQLPLNIYKNISNSGRIEYLRI